MPPTKTNIHILDVGCGTGLISADLQKLGEVHSLDQSAKAVLFCKKKGLQNTYQGNVCDLPFKANMFDLVVALDVLEHIEDDHLAIQEISRVLKNQGTFICFVPAFPFLWTEQDSILKHWRRYTKTTLNNLFNTEWSCIKIGYFNSLLFPIIFTIRIFKKILNIKSKKDELEQMSSLNDMLYYIFKSELAVLPRFGFPFGVSLMGVYRKHVKK